MSREYQLKTFRAPIDLQINYAQELNEQQCAAVTALPGPALVIAGAGSGKTRTLTYRVAFLLEQGIPPEQILLLTFTNKAAREMMRRVADILGSEVASLWGGTFHSIAYRILRRHADRFGFRNDFTILDRADAKEMLKACMDEARIDVAATRFPKPEVLFEVFSLAANTHREIKEVLEEQYDYFSGLLESIRDLQTRFEQRKRSAQMVDFDDLLVFWLRLLREHEDVRDLYQRRFQFVLVDEYQDTNKLQSDIIDLLAARHQNLMVVGDDSQSIYSWRGANFRNILEFPKRYPKARVYKIEANYRSTPEILQLANAAIAPNLHQFEKRLVAARKSGSKPVLAACATGDQQAAFVAQRALELRDEGISLNEMAVLYRSHFHALELQLELTRRNIPFAITSGIRFFEQAHIKDAVAYIKLITNPHDELSFKRLIRMLPGVGSKSADKLWTSFHESMPNEDLPAARDTTVSEGAQSPLPDPTARSKPGSPPLIAAALQRCSSAVPKKTAVAWAQFSATIAQLEAEPVRNQSAKMIRLILEAGYDEYLKDNFPNYRARIEDLEQLATFSLQFKSTDEFLSQLALLSNLEAEEDQAPDTEQVRLSTIHQAKGLEFGVVFIIMLCDGLFPHGRSFDDLEKIEEERRLFYVAVTRAKNELYLSYPLFRMTRPGDEAMQTPSRFILELSKDLLDEWDLISG
jgi:DNA helicase II / ATP-dependent DNA helicase PcrA